MNLLTSRVMMGPAAAILMLAFLPAANTSGCSTPAGGTPDAGDAGSSADVGTDQAAEAAAKQTTVFTIVMENHDYQEIVGSPNAPYINSLIASYGLATNYFDSETHPSLPNYLYMVSGATQYFGTVDLPPTTPLVFPVAKDNLGSQLEVAGVNWRSYQESMGSPCNLADTGTYAAKHNPFVYFSDIQTNTALCQNRIVDYSNFAGDLAANAYRYLWITPNLLSDGHDPALDPVTGLKQSDAWLSTELPKILASSAYQAGGILFLTWDEAEGRNGDSADQVPMIIISPRIKAAGYKSNVKYTHANFLATVEDLFAVPRLGAAVGVSNMMEFLQ